MPDLPEWLVRERLDRENELLSHRISWVVASQAFLLSAYGNCLVGGSGEAHNPNARRLELLLAVLPWTGILSLLALYVTVFAALVTMWRLRRVVEQSHAMSHSAVGDPPLRRAGLAGPLVVPCVFLVTWVLLLVR